MKSIRIALLALATLLASTVHASGYEVRSKTISLSGLDLTRPAGAARAYQSIRSAALSVCRDLDHAPALRSQLWKSCVTDAIARAVADVNAPALTAYHAEKARKPVRVVAR